MKLVAAECNEKPEAWRWVLASVFSTALATLLAELALTRIFSNPAAALRFLIQLKEA